MEKVIKLAIEAGYEYKGDGYWSLPHESYLIDPKFWQALGKSLGWGEKCKNCGSIANGLCQEHKYIRDWKIPWHRFIDHLAEGKDVDEFFKDLIK